jgi:hypothetical protein
MKNIDATLTKFCFKDLINGLNMRNPPDLKIRMSIEGTIQTYSAAQVKIFVFQFIHTSIHYREIH